MVHTTPLLGTRAFFPLQTNRHYETRRISTTIVSSAEMRGPVFASFFGSFQSSAVFLMASANQPTRRNATGKHHMIVGQRTTKYYHQRTKTSF